ncbi:hypothetical protein G6O67_005719 [Ophiocordyceps sinensis]|uniref:tRNA-splicing endonuclease subunit Sen34 n=2 Tax=Ophiocordyceps sinensis TaxID=72228 RepID=A0A8H4LWZ0_9HYPO|nr:tRNA-splicing endonuclease subunit sen34 [Ophiocordyceps sinensis CO18]KAF4507043.1 hypothetical protein G6O67_005719 [Ophiocordyceps sinensis]
MAKSRVEMPASELASPVRICKVAESFLIFEPEAAALVRRKHNISGTLVGTTPQQPTQNIFLGLPIEMRPEEVDALVRLGAAYVVDIAAAHRAALSLSAADAASRKTYVEYLRRRKLAAQQAFVERNARKVAEAADRLGRPRFSSTQEPTLASATQLQPQPRQTDAHVSSLTLVSSSDVMPSLANHQPSKAVVTEGALCRHLQAGGYYTTPGLRFGAQYSVYPGDPLRFHAHFMANQYGWHDEIAILDVVSGGRLATAVKKSFLLGGQQSPPEISSVRTFSMEWAAM